jgi:hypothetical protein
MATSPNFNWPEPDNTDLVKNGALAIRTAVNAIDTSLVDLKGGTTGQVLAKASGTDMDFAWVAQDDANAIQNTQLTAKGALISAVSAGTPATLTVGTNNQVLTADSTTATGLKWATPAGGGGKVLQVVTAVYGTATTITSTSFTDTGLTATITPTLATSKILVLIMQPMAVNRQGARAYANTQLLRGGTTLLGVNGNATLGLYTGGAESALFGQFNTSYLDSPATTSSTTYKTQGQVYEATSSANVIYNQQMTSTITLIEIGA